MSNNEVGIQIKHMIQQGLADGDKLLAIFDQAEPIPCEFMFGQWRGAEIKTGHPIEGLLELSKWYGKVFKDKEHVYPLIFLDERKGILFAGDPKYIPLNEHVGVFQKVGKLMPLATKVLKTYESKARARMIEFRGKSSATMIYDEKPINDHFRKISENMVLGIMDLKSIVQPYFFILERDDQSIYTLDL